LPKKFYVLFNDEGMMILNTANPDVKLVTKWARPGDRIGEFYLTNTGTRGPKHLNWEHGGVNATIRKKDK
jgi:hypothetical protein